MMLTHLVPPPELTEEETDALRQNLFQLNDKYNRNVLRSNYYNLKKYMDVIGFSVPPEMRQLESVIGWPQKTIDGLAGRLKLEGFVGDKGNSTDELDEMLTLNGMAAEWPQVWVSTLIHGCSFVSVTPGDEGAGEPAALIQPMPATEATGVWDVRRRRLESALWSPEPKKAELPKLAVLFTKDSIITMERDRDSSKWQVDKVKNPLPRVAVTPMRYKPQLARTYGQSRITRAVMYLTQLAMRSLLRTEVSAEFYSSPQRWAMGVDPEAFVDPDTNQRISPWETTLGKLWTIGRDDDGELPQVGQFQQATMEPNISMMRMIATLFAAETNLPLNSLGIVQDNPASAEAIDAMWADMVQLAEQCHTELGVPATEVGQNVMMTIDRSMTLKKLTKMRVKWRDASTPTQAAMADAVTKLVGAGILQPDSEVALESLGYDQTDIERIKKEHDKAKEDDPQSKLMNALNGQEQAALPPGQPPVPAPAGPPVAKAAPVPAKKAVANVGSNR